MNAGVPRETDYGRVEGWVLGKTFTIQSIPELRAFLFSQTLSFLLPAASRTRRASIKVFEGHFWIEVGRAGRHEIWIQTDTYDYKRPLTSRRHLGIKGNRPPAGKAQSRRCYQLLSLSERCCDELDEQQARACDVEDVHRIRGRFVCCRAQKNSSSKLSHRFLPSNAQQSVLPTVCLTCVRRKASTSIHRVEFCAETMYRELDAGDGGESCN